MWGWSGTQIRQRQYQNLYTGLCEGGEDGQRGRSEREGPCLS